MPTCYMMVGAPATGKTTFYHETLNAFPRLSSDEFIEVYASSLGLKYQDVFNDYVKTAMKLFNQQVDNFIKDQRDFVWDQTNLTRKSRAKKIYRLKGYSIVAVVFEPDLIKHQIYYQSRPDKVPWPVILEMRQSYERPTVMEGFSAIMQT